MKALFYILPLAATFLLSSCEDDKIDVAPIGTSPGGMSATVEGTQWTARASHTLVTSSGDEILLMGTQLLGNSFSKQITLKIKGFDGKGTYDSDQVTAGITVNSLNTEASASPQSWSTAGSSDAKVKLVVTRYDEAKGLASGTFSFTAVGTNGLTSKKTVSSGAFESVRLVK